jgi:hypothetical protein
VGSRDGGGVNRHSIWKLAGLAGLAGVAVTGVAVARSERQRRSFTPEDVRARLQERLVGVEAARPPGSPHSGHPGR